MGRPRSFDQDEALDRALETFWHQGYAGTSIQNLVDAMEINRASLYNTFGGKHDLYVEALRRYNRKTVDRLLATLRSAASPMDGIRALFEEVADEVAACPKQGSCFITNTATELGTDDEEAAQQVRDIFQRLEDGFTDALHAHYDAASGATPEDVSDATLRARARFLVNTLQGLRVLAKTEPDRDELQDIVNVAMTALDVEMTPSA